MFSQVVNFYFTPICSSAARKPHRDAVGDDAERHQQLLLSVVPPELSEEIKCCALFSFSAVFGDQERFSETWTPRNLKVCTLTTHTLMQRREDLSHASS